MTYPSAFNLLATYRTPDDGSVSDQYPTYGTLLTQVKVGLPIAFALGYLTCVGIGKYQEEKELDRKAEEFGRDFSRALQRRKDLDSNRKRL